MRMKDQDKQLRIKEAMVRLFLQEGIDGVSISKIAREAGISQATIYVYYSSKEEMLAEVFREYSKKPLGYMRRSLEPDMSAAQLIEAIVRSTCRFSREHEEVFSFVEQCSRNPVLSELVCERECCCELLDLLHAYQEREQLRRCDDWNLLALLFAPVRFLAVNKAAAQPEGEARLEELIRMLQDLLLR